MADKFYLNKTNRNLFMNKMDIEESTFNSKYPRLMEKQVKFNGFSLNPYSQFRKIVTEMSGKFEEDGLCYFAGDFPYRDDIELFLKDYCNNQESRASKYQGYMDECDSYIRKLRLIKAFISIHKKNDLLYEYAHEARCVDIFDAEFMLSTFGTTRYALTATRAFSSSELQYNYFKKNGVLDDIDISMIEEGYEERRYDRNYHATPTATLFLGERLATGEAVKNPSQFLLEHDRELFEKTYLKDVFMLNYPQFKKIAEISDIKHQLVKKDESK